MNILILSAGTRNKIVQYFKRAVGSSGRVIAADMSPYAPAIYEADERFRLPSIHDPGYIEAVLKVCKKEKVDGVLSLIDPELSLLALNSDRFKDAGVTVIGSDYHLCELALDKFRMYRWLSDHGYRCAKSYLGRDEFYCDLTNGAVSFPVFVKPVCGSASIAIQKVHDEFSLDFALNSGSNLMVQEFLNGHEIGADVYVDMISGEVVSIFTKRKLVMRAGETDKSVSFKEQALFDLIVDFCHESGFRGQVDIDLFDIDGNYYISEVNPRFGGGYPHAYECGCDHMSLILNNLAGCVNEPHIGDYPEGVAMMKYNEVIVRAINPDETCFNGRDASDE